MTGNACCSCLTILCGGSVPSYIKNSEKVGEVCECCGSDFANFYLRADEIKAVKEKIAEDAKGKE